jgi:thymidylate synthase (FAD)
MADLNQQINVLDHGYVRCIEAWGSGEYGRLVRHSDVVEREQEAGIIEAARQSTQGSFRGWNGECICGLTAVNQSKTKLGIPISETDVHDRDCRYNKGDENLLKFLYSNKHFTPFEFAGMIIEVQAPIFVFREWQRHRTQSYNETSARYAPLPDLYYRPDPKMLASRIIAAITASNKQQSSVASSEADPTVLADFFLSTLSGSYSTAEDSYQWALASGIPKELARLCMPVGHYSRMRAGANLRNWLAFMTLRCDPAAQWEIRQFAEAVSSLIAEHFPRTHALWLANS